MKGRLFPIYVLLLSLAVTAVAMAEKPANQTAAENKLVVYYFHNNYRCATCKKIEAYTQETVTTKFADDIKSGRMSFQMVNVDEPANKHFIKEYKIITKQVVLVEMKNGTQAKWKNLDKIWDFIGDKGKFTTYIDHEIKNFKGGS